MANEYHVRIRRKRSRRVKALEPEHPYSWSVHDDRDHEMEGTAATLSDAQREALSFILEDEGISITWEMPNRRVSDRFPFFQAIAVIALFAFGSDVKAEPSIASNCEELVPYITATDEWPVLKIFDPAQFAPFFTNTFQQDMNRRLAGLPTAFDYVLPPSERLLDCFGTARFKDGGQGRIQFWLDQDPDGEQFIGYKEVQIGF